VLEPAAALQQAVDAFFSCKKVVIQLLPQLT
jgi:hypothetical protein